MANEYVNKVVLGSSTLIDLTADTAIASDVAAGKYFHLATGERVVGTSEGGEGSDLIITLSDVNGVWTPDKTFAEIADAYGDGRDIAVRTNDASVIADGFYDDEEYNALCYTVDYFDYDTNAYMTQWYIYDSNGVTDDGNAVYYQTLDATAGPSDVASGKVAYGASGKFVGTASGGGDDTDFANTIMRSGAITRIPDSVTNIGDYAFYRCTNLALTELPSGVTSIGSYAFDDCTNLALTELPSGVTSIGPNAFDGCTNLALTELPSGVTSIGSYTFRDCSGFQQLDAQNVGTISANAFNACYSLTELVLRKSGTACTLRNVSAFTNTPMRGYNGKSGTVYVPSALISTYQTATNWSTLYNAGHLTFAAIEGSEYERD